MLVHGEYAKMEFLKQKVLQEFGMCVSHVLIKEGVFRSGLGELWQPWLEPRQ